MESEPESQPCPFTDVPKGSYYEKAVAWAAANGIVNGVSEDSFAPNNNITREQMATMIYRYAKYKGLDISVVEKTDIASYDDYNSISQYAIEPAKYVVGTKIMIGRTETTFNPLEYTTRAEMATVLMRMLDKMN
jgi:cobalamin-dependent methionine synthase I